MFLTEYSEPVSPAANRLMFRNKYVGPWIRLTALTNGRIRLGILLRSLALNKDIFNTNHAFTMSILWSSNIYFLIMSDLVSLRSDLGQISFTARLRLGGILPSVYDLCPIHLRSNATTTWLLSKPPTDYQRAIGTLFHLQWASSDLHAVLMIGSDQCRFCAWLCSLATRQCSNYDIGNQLTLRSRQSCSGLMMFMTFGIFVQGRKPRATLASGLILIPLRVTERD